MSAPPPDEPALADRIEAELARGGDDDWGAPPPDRVGCALDLLLAASSSALVIALFAWAFAALRRLLFT